MPLLQPPSINKSHFCVLGDVRIDDSAAIAPGVILQADTNFSLTIGAGVCIGMGTILHAHQGNLEIQTGAVLGAGVLVVGAVTIGANACIGSTTTIWNTHVDPEGVIIPGSLVGKIGREVVFTQQETQVITTTTEVAVMAASIETLPPSPIATPTTSTFVSPTTPPVDQTPSNFISPPPLPLVNSTFVDPNPGFTHSNNSQNSNSPNTQNLPNSQNSAPNTQANPANFSAPADQKPEAESPEKPEAETENNPQFYGKNRIERLLGTLMPPNKPFI
ncbi:MAG: transferase [Coleofasciculaceae cyanobacterium SM2_1_6]|nr:transferase [Coleofasciculaceae cyanobacterium SM2_1_6]